MNEKFCQECGQKRHGQQPACAGCGYRFESTSGNVASAGRDMHGAMQAGRDIIVNPSDPAPPAGEFDPVPLWRSPFTSGVLTWVSVLLGAAAFLPGWKVLESAKPGAGPLFRNGDSQAGAPSGMLAVLALAFLVVLFAATASLASVAYREVRLRLFGSFALNGLGRRITLERIETKPCPTCGGRLQFRTVPLAWVPKYVNGTYTGREVTAKTMGIVCNRDSDHWWRVQSADPR